MFGVFVFFSQRPLLGEAVIVRSVILKIEKPGEGLGFRV